MRIRVWKGYHHPALSEWISQSWKNEDLLILCPPQFEEDFTFLSFLPEGELEFIGDWNRIPVIKRTQSRIFPEKPVFGVFSSGTIGRKLILYSKENIESSLKAILSLFDTKAYTSIFCYPQPFHTFGLILGYCHSLLYSKKLFAVDGPYATSSHEAWLNREDGKLMTLGTPTHFKDLLLYQQKSKKVPRLSYSSIIGAAKVERELWEKCKSSLRIEFPSIGYGATEASPGITHLSPGVPPLEDGEVGFFLSHLKVKLFPKEGLEFSGPGVCLATIQNQVLDFPKSIFIKDILEKREDGVLVYKGRAELVLNRGGEKFVLEEIEAFLKKEMNTDSVCLSLPHPRLGEELGIVVKNPKSSKDRIYETLKQRFGREFDGGLYHSLEEFPLNANSKVDRGECKKIMEEKIAVSAFHL